MTNKEEWHDRMAGDRHIKEMGIIVEEARLGYSKVSITIEERHLNGLGVTNGGVVFSLADYAFGVASNAERGPSVGATVTISFLRGTKTGDTLTAICTVDKQGSKIGFYDVDILDQSGNLIATAKGTSCVI